MTLQRLNPPDVHAPGGYSHAVVAEGRLLFVSGQIGLDADRKVTGADFDTQARQAFRNMTAVLKAAGADLSDVVRLGVILTSRDQLPRFREIRSEAFAGGPLPASTLIIANLILPELLVELEATARLR